MSLYVLKRLVRQIDAKHVSEFYIKLVIRVVVPDKPIEIFLSG